MCIRDSPTALHHQPDRVRLELPAELPPLAHANTLSPFHGLLQVSTLSRQVQCFAPRATAGSLDAPPSDPPARATEQARAMGGASPFPSLACSARSGPAFPPAALAC